jgi:hypothetical protein
MLIGLIVFAIVASIVALNCGAIAIIGKTSVKKMLFNDGRFERASLMVANVLIVGISVVASIVAIVCNIIMSMI